MFSQKSAEEAVDSLLKTGINFVAIDFDSTMITHHTGGRYHGEPQELAKSVRHVFRVLVPLMMEKDISIAIVTFSSQSDLIREVMRISFPGIGEKIVVRGRDSTWGVMGAMLIDGKQKNMASAADELGRLYPDRDFTRNSTLLVDDDMNNIKISLANCVRAIYFNPDHPERLIGDLIELSTRPQFSATSASSSTG